MNRDTLLRHIAHIIRTWRDSPHMKDHVEGAKHLACHLLGDEGVDWDDAKALIDEAVTRQDAEAVK